MLRRLISEVYISTSSHVQWQPVRSDNKKQDKYSGNILAGDSNHQVCRNSDRHNTVQMGNKTIIQFVSGLTIGIGLSAVPEYKTRITSSINKHCKSMEFYKRPAKRREE